MRMLCREGWGVVGAGQRYARAVFRSEWNDGAECHATANGVSRAINMSRSISAIVARCSAAQPSHDKAASIPYEGFDVNAGGTMNLLVAARICCR